MILIQKLWKLTPSKTQLAKIYISHFYTCLKFVIFLPNNLWSNFLFLVSKANFENMIYYDSTKVSQWKFLRPYGMLTASLKQPKLIIKFLWKWKVLKVIHIKNKLGKKSICQGNYTGIKSKSNFTFWFNIWNSLHWGN